jgi:hypothetical protein
VLLVVIAPILNMIFEHNVHLVVPLPLSPRPPPLVFISSCRIIKQTTRKYKNVVLCLVTPLHAQVEREILEDKALGVFRQIPNNTRWGSDAKAVYVNLWTLGYDKNMKSGGAPCYRN